jgi:hypothetical protein
MELIALAHVNNRSLAGQKYGNAQRQRSPQEYRGFQ